MNTTEFARRAVLHGTLIAASLVCASSTALSAQNARPLKSIPSGYRLIEGDIIVKSNDPKGIGPLAVYPTDSSKYWVDGIVPYMFNWDVSLTNRSRMLAAMAEWEAVANVHFKPRSGEADFVFIFSDGEGNWSAVGRQGGQQDLSIVNWSSKFIMVHELGHALGFWHEQSRSDRIFYVSINWDNIEDGQEHNFEVHNEASHYGPYDFDSLMHYGACAFSVCSSCNCADAACRTINVLPPWSTQWQCAIGQRTHLSTNDARVMSFLYPQSDWRFVDETSSMPLGTFLCPFPTFVLGEATVPSGGTVWMLRPGTYSATGTHTKAMTIRASLGEVTLR